MQVVNNMWLVVAGVNENNNYSQNLNFKKWTIDTANGVILISTTNDMHQWVYSPGACTTPSWTGS